MPEGPPTTMTRCIIRPVRRRLLDRLPNQVALERQQRRTEQEGVEDEATRQWHLEEVTHDRHQSGGDEGSHPEDPELLRPAAEGVSGIGALGRPSPREPQRNQQRAGVPCKVVRWLGARSPQWRRRPEHRCGQHREREDGGVEADRQPDEPTETATSTPGVWRVCDHLVRRVINGRHTSLWLTISDDTVDVRPRPSSTIASRTGFVGSTRGDSNSYGWHAPRVSLTPSHGCIVNGR